MQKRGDRLRRPAKALTAGIGRTLTKLACLGNAGRFLGGKPEVVATAAGLAFVAGAGWVNLEAGKGLNFEFLYLLGCGLVGWIGGARGAMLCVVVSGGFMALADTGQRQSVAPGWVLWCNSLVRMGVFAGIAWLSAQVGKLVRDLERMAAQRGARLEQEIEDHSETTDMLREGTELLGLLTRNIADVFWVTDPSKSRVDYVSRGFERVWGEARETLYASPGAWFEGIHQEDRERVRRAAFTRQVTGQYDEEYRVIRPDGGVRWVHDRAFPVKNQAGAVERIVGIVEDITERKGTEQLLQAERDMGVTLSSASELAQVLPRVLEIAVRLEGIDCGGVYLTDAESGGLRLEAHLGLSGPFAQRVAQYAAEAAEARLAKGGRSLFLDCEQISRSAEELWGAEGFRALALVPIQRTGVVLGLLILASWRRDEITPGTRIGIEMIASQVAGAVARIQAEDSLRRTQRQILEISDREQARIGQDLHDGLCQQLIGMGFTANSLEQALSREQRPEAALARKLYALLDESITESRGVCRGLYPIRLSTQGLLPALEDLAATAHERYHICCVCEADRRPVDCGLSTAGHLYRIAQEAVNNAVKHSGARNVTIRLSGGNGGLALSVKDDGKGMTRPAAADSGTGSGMGLHIMEYRARLIGGALQLQSGPGGTEVCCRLPRLARST
jgi:PAS domain S-box-containing protein